MKSSLVNAGIGIVENVVVASSLVVQSTPLGMSSIQNSVPKLTGIPLVLSLVLL